MTMQIIEVASILNFLVCNVIATASKYQKEKIPLPSSEVTVFKQAFYSTKVETLYQCMELCSQFLMCKSLWEISGTCELYKVTLEDALDIRMGGNYYEASWIPKSISGVCHNHTCSKDKQCVPLHSDDYMCIPHKFPTFTCEGGYYSTRKCLYIYEDFDLPRTWEEAKGFCGDLKLNLTEIQFSEDQSFFQSYVWYITDRRSLYERMVFFWTSLHYVSAKKAWIWNESGRIQDNSSFSNWLPNHQQLIKPDQDNCMALSTNTSYQWTVTNCSAKGLFFCERLMV